MRRRIAFSRSSVRGSDTRPHHPNRRRVARPPGQTSHAPQAQVVGVASRDGAPHLIGDVVGLGLLPASPTKLWYECNARQQNLEQRANPHAPSPLSWPEAARANRSISSSRSSVRRSGTESSLLGWLEVVVAAGVIPL